MWVHYNHSHAKMEGGRRLQEAGHYRAALCRDWARHILRGRRHCGTGLEIARHDTTRHDTTRHDTT